MMEGDFFITPHAVKQFQRRIAPWLSYEQALGEIINELRKADDFRPTQNGKAFYVRTKDKWEFRAIIRAGLDLPAVVTILRSGRGAKSASNRNRKKR